MFPCEFFFAVCRLLSYFPTNTKFSVLPHISPPSCFRKVWCKADVSSVNPLSEQVEGFKH